ncbi:MAG: hypothetical protein JWO03_1216 [Bacteroidetes bacterium]|nr:hypothetical protein [Bacteroidota bacterium]
MNLHERKQRIIDIIKSTQKDSLLDEITTVLDINDHMKSPDWHMPLVLKAYEDYKANPDKVVKWEDIKKQWDSESKEL